MPSNEHAVEQLYGSLKLSNFFTATLVVPNFLIRLCVSCASVASRIARLTRPIILDQYPYNIYVNIIYVNIEHVYYHLTDTLHND